MSDSMWPQRRAMAPLEQRDTRRCHVQPLHMVVLCPEHGGGYTEFMAVRCTRVMEHQWPLGCLYAYKYGGGSVRPRTNNLKKTFVVKKKENVSDLFSCFFTQITLKKTVFIIFVGQHQYISFLFF